MQKKSVADAEAIDAAKQAQRASDEAAKKQREVEQLAEELAALGED